MKCLPINHNRSSTTITPRQASISKVHFKTSSPRAQLILVWPLHRCCSKKHSKAQTCKILKPHAIIKARTIWALGMSTITGWLFRVTFQWKVTSATKVYSAIRVYLSFYFAMTIKCQASWARGVEMECKCHNTCSMPKITLAKVSLMHPCMIIIWVATNLECQEVTQHSKLLLLEVTNRSEQSLVVRAFRF